MQELLIEINMTLNGPSPERPPATPSGNSLALHEAGGKSTVTGGVSCPLALPGNTESIGGFDIIITGEIDATTVYNVRKFFAEHREHQRKERAGTAPCHIYGYAYSINSFGGSVPAAMEIGRMFRNERAWLGVGFRGGGTCVSACILVLAGAIDRKVEDGTVGIHRPYFTSPQQAVTAEQVKEAYGRMLQDLRAYLKEMDVSERLADDMLAIEPENVRFLTKSQLEGYGLSGVARTEQQTKATENEARVVLSAKNLGIDRAEYNRRKALGEQICPSSSTTGKYPREWLDCRSRVLRTGRNDPPPPPAPPQKQPQGIPWRTQL
jgi:ATP-dependent protease ClpP protease subunit